MRPSERDPSTTLSILHIDIIVSYNAFRRTKNDFMKKSTFVFTVLVLIMDNGVGAVGFVHTRSIVVGYSFMYESVPNRIISLLDL